MVLAGFSNFNSIGATIKAKYIVINGIRIDKDYGNFVPETFGRLTTLGPKFRLRRESGELVYYQVCQCTCGSVAVYGASNVVQGRSSQCLSCASKATGERVRKHGESKSTEYKAWCRIKERCYNPKEKRYADWGGRGIRVCDRWLDPENGYANFLADMGRRPPDCTSINRIDNDGNYEPGNCRWATAHEQSRNHRRNRILSYNGRSQCIADWAEELGMPKGLLCQRKLRGWSDEKTLTTPPMHPNPRPPKT